MPLIVPRIVAVPEPASMRLPAGPRLILPVMLMTPAPARVRPQLPWQLISPLTDNVPASQPIVASPDAVMGPAMAFEPPRFSTAPCR